MSAAELPAAFRRKVDVGQPVDCPHCKSVGYAAVPTKDGRVLALICPTCEGRGTVLVLSALPVSPEELAEQLASAHEIAVKSGGLGTTVADMGMLSDDAAAKAKARAEQNIREAREAAKR